MVLALWGPPPGPTWGPHIFLTNLNTPKDVPASLVKIQPGVSTNQEDENVKSLRTTDDYDARRTTDENGSVQSSLSLRLG